MSQGSSGCFVDQKMSFSREQRRWALRHNKAGGGTGSDERSFGEKWPEQSLCTRFYRRDAPSNQGIESWQACNEFEPSTSKEPSCTLNLRPPVGVV
ncbi:hypothetical protein TNCV_2031711 [Trichonephila clavipes]|nr:hypothetical protein TNCV_2031711 [Trichonephila clavipes]